jgi:hypothetical protein
MDLMFESSLLPVLRDDATLASLVSTFANSPSIFSEFAPEKAAFPYIVFRITRSMDIESEAVQKFNIYVDYFNYGVSGVQSRQAAERIEMLLDRTNLQHARYNSIRIFFFSGGTVNEDDPRAIHYNLMFEARAGRINVCKRFTTIGE